MIRPNVSFALAVGGIATMALAAACTGSPVETASSGAAPTTTELTALGSGGAVGRDDHLTLDPRTSCDDLLAKVNALRPAAAKCCPTCALVQCTQAVNDICCPISVNRVTASEVVAFEAAVTAYTAQCSPFCATMRCPEAPSHSCALTGECN